MKQKRPGKIPGRIIVWAEMDSNHRRHKPTGLQPVPFGRSGTDPRPRMVAEPAHVSTFRGSFFVRF